MERISTPINTSPWYDQGYPVPSWFQRSRFRRSRAGAAAPGFGEHLLGALHCRRRGLRGSLFWVPTGSREPMCWHPRLCAVSGLALLSISSPPQYDHGSSPTSTARLRARPVGAAAWLVCRNGNSQIRSMGYSYVVGYGLRRCGTLWYLVFSTNLASLLAGFKPNATRARCRTVQIRRTQILSLLLGYRDVKRSVDW